MSHQFAGIAWALVHDRYNGLNLEFLPTCSVGLEQERVRQFQEAHPTATVLGSVEQNVFLPTLVRTPSLQTTAVAAMFRTSPLCIVSLQETTKKDNMTIGAHEDTVELLQRLFPQHNVIASPRSSKVTDLRNGTVDAIQAYTTTEVATLEAAMPHESLHVTPLEGLDDAHLGYSQVLFTTKECLEDADRRDTVANFLQHTFDGWKESIRNPEEAIRAVREAQKLLKLDDEHNDHWHASADLSILRNCNDAVKATFQGDRYGVIHPARWNAACDWLLPGGDMGERRNFGLDDSVWQPPSHLMAGNELAHTILAQAKKSALRFAQQHGRKPSLAVVTVGELSRYEDSQRRLEIYGNKASSWFSKTNTGAANGFLVEEHCLDPATTTEELLSLIYKLRATTDGIQLMWPLPAHIDGAELYNAINLDSDVDGMHYIGQCQVGNKAAFPPVTPAAVLALIDAHNVDIQGKRVLVVGRSPIVGSPLAHMLRERGGTVTNVHSDTPRNSLKQLIGETDVLAMCVGQPDLIPLEWIPQDAIVLQVGTTFQNDELVSDIAGNLGNRQHSPVPGGIGPLSNAFLFNSVARAAWKHAGSKCDWTHVPDSLRKTFHFDSYDAALKAAQCVNHASALMDHHANMTFSHKCVDGVDLEMQFFSYEAKQVTPKDHAAATVVDHLISENSLEMDQFRYDLQEGAIAKYPASPRGSSKLLHVDAAGEVLHFGNFSSSFAELVEGCHIVFNDSKVADARLFLKSDTAPENKLELMLLDLGNEDLNKACKTTPLRAMIRSEDVVAGQTLESHDGKFSLVVQEVVG